MFNVQSPEDWEAFQPEYEERKRLLEEMICPNCEQEIQSVRAVKTLEEILILSEEDGELEGRYMGDQAVGDTEAYFCPECLVEIEMPENFTEID
jgi:hypothetical protein